MSNGRNWKNQDNVEEFILDQRQDGHMTGAIEREWRPLVQGSEEWDKLRYTMPTASNFSRLITPKQLKVSGQIAGYAAELVAKQRGLWCPAPPTYWMQHGTEWEPLAVSAYESKYECECRPGGFGTLRSDVMVAGASPDRLVGDDGLLEVKCLAPQEVISLTASGDVSKYMPQVQGQLWVMGSQWRWCDLFAFHPGLPPYRQRIARDEEFIAALSVCVQKFWKEFERINEQCQGTIGEEYLIQTDEVVQL